VSSISGSYGMMSKFRDQRPCIGIKYCSSGQQLQCCCLDEVRSSTTTADQNQNSAKNLGKEIRKKILFEFK
jgi:hypothetical protein